MNVLWYVNFRRYEWHFTADKHDFWAKIVSATRCQHKMLGKKCHFKLFSIPNPELTSQNRESGQEPIFRASGKSLLKTLATEWGALLEKMLCETNDLTLLEMWHSFPRPLRKKVLSSFRREEFQQLEHWEIRELNCEKSRELASFLKLSKNAITIEAFPVN